jgi:hypothetical protein
MYYYFYYCCCCCNINDAVATVILIGTGTRKTKDRPWTWFTIRLSRESFLFVKIALAYTSHYYYYDFRVQLKNYYFSWLAALANSFRPINYDHYPRRQPRQRPWKPFVYVHCNTTERSINFLYNSANRSDNFIATHIIGGGRGTCITRE